MTPLVSVHVLGHIGCRLVGRETFALPQHLLHNYLYSWTSTVTKSVCWRYFSFFEGFLLFFWCLLRVKLHSHQSG